MTEFGIINCNLLQSKLSAICGARIKSVIRFFVVQGRKHQFTKLQIGPLYRNMLPVVIANLSDTEQLLQYVANCTTECKVAPAYVLYLCALHLSKKSERNLKSFLKKAALMIYSKIENPKYTIEEAFWLANASELLHFLKYDKSLSKSSEEAQDCLTTTIQSIFKDLLVYFVDQFKGNIGDSNYLDGKICAINEITAELEEFYVNVAFINQFLSFLLQWVCGKLIANIDEHPLSYSGYFKELRLWAITMDDECLLNKVTKFECLLEDGSAQNVEDTNKADFIKLKWQPPQFLEKYYAGTYNTFIETGLKLLSEITSEKAQHLQDEAVALRLLIPYIGYSCDNIIRIPEWLLKLFRPVHENGWCTLQCPQGSSGNWNVHLKGQNVERLALMNLQIQTQPNVRVLNRRVVGHVTGLSSPVSNFNVGDQILSINGSTLREITGETAEEFLIRCPGRFKLEVVKIDTCKVLLRTPTSTPEKAHAEEPPLQEATIKFNLVESSEPKSREDLLQNIHSEQANIFQNIIREVEGLNSMLEQFEGNSENDRSYTYMKEIMMRNIIKLDNMDTGDSREVKEERRKVIYFIQDKIEELKAKLIANQERNKDDTHVNLDRKEVHSGNSTEAVAKETKTASPTEENCNGDATTDTEDVFEKQNMLKQCQLIGEIKYELNSLETKFVSTGIYPSSKHNVPALKFSFGNSHLLLGMDDWKALLSFEHLLREHSQNKIRHWIQKNVGSYELYLGTDYVTIQNKNMFFCLNQQCVHNLLQLSHLITSRMNLMKRYCKRLQLIVADIAQSPGDPIAELNQQIINMNSEISHIIREYIYFYPEVFRKSVEMIGKRPNTQPKGEKRM